MPLKATNTGGRTRKGLQKVNGEYPTIDLEKKIESIKRNNSAAEYTPEYRSLNLERSIEVYIYNNTDVELTANDHHHLDRGGFADRSSGFHINSIPARTSVRIPMTSKLWYGIVPCIKGALIYNLPELEELPDEKELIGLFFECQGDICHC